MPLGVDVEVHRRQVLRPAVRRDHVERGSAVGGAAGPATRGEREVRPPGIGLEEAGRRGGHPATRLVAVQQDPRLVRGRGGDVERHLILPVRSAVAVLVGDHHQAETAGGIGRAASASAASPPASRAFTLMAGEAPRGP